jgi:hypothetical protein
MTGQNLFADKNMLRPGWASLGSTGLAEPRATNFLLWSTDFNNAAWSLFNGATKGAAVAGPDGTLTGMTLGFANASANNQIFQSGAVSAGLTFSVYARARTLSRFTLSLSAEGSSPIFALSASEWRRFSMTTTTNNANVAIQNAASDTGSIDIWGPQMEQSPYATSYIPTGPVAMTRTGYATRPPGPPSGVGAPPMVAIATGLGNGGASIAGGSDSASGRVWLTAGIGAGANGTLSLQWPVTPPASALGIMVAADFATLVVTQGNPLSIAWTAPGPLLANSRPHHLSWQWVNMN